MSFMEEWTCDHINSLQYLDSLSDIGGKALYWEMGGGKALYWEISKWVGLWLDKNQEQQQNNHEVLKLSLAEFHRSPWYSVVPKG